MNNGFGSHQIYSILTGAKGKRTEQHYLFCPLPPNLIRENNYLQQKELVKKKGTIREKLFFFQFTIQS